jgi:hypothetical protein
MQRLKTLLAFLVVGAMIFLGYKLLPPYYANYQLQDDIDTIARFSTYAQNKGETDIQVDVIAKAHDHGIDLTREEVKVQRDASGVQIDVNYDVTVPVPGHVFKLTFNPTAGNRMITAK